MAVAAEPLLATEDLCKSFGGVRALDGVSFSLQAGELLGLIGRGRLAERQLRLERVQLGRKISEQVSAALRGHRGAGHGIAKRQELWPG